MSDSVVVVGGGFTGLVAAHRLQQLGVGAIVLEGSDRVGGKLVTGTVGDGPVDLGPDSFLAREAILVDLCEELGLSPDLVPPVGFGAQVWLEDGLHRLPPTTYFGIPLVADDAAGILSPGGVRKVRAEETAAVGALPDDMSVGELVTERFGSEVLEKMVDPVLAGTRAGDPFHVSARSALPEAWQALAEGRTLTATLRELRRDELGGPPPFLGLRGGMQRLAQSLAEALGGDAIRTGSPARSIVSEGDGYRIHTDDEVITTPAAIVTTPPQAASALLEGTDPHLGHALGHFKAADVAIVALSFPPRTDLPELPEGSGLLVPRGRGRTLTGATWYSRKWPGSFPGGSVIRCFAEGSLDDPLPQDDEDLATRLLDDLRAALGDLPGPTDARVARWPAGLPIYEVGHDRRVTSIERRLRRFPRLRLAGAAYRGSGLPDCARQAVGAADEIAASLGAAAR